MINPRHTAPWLRFLFQWVVALVLVSGPVMVHAGRSKEPEPESRQQKISVPAPRPDWEADSATLASLQSPGGDSIPLTQQDSTTSKAMRPANAAKPNSGLPNSKVNWPGIVGLSLEGLSVLIIALALFFVPFALGGFFGLALFIGYIGHFFALAGMSPSYKNRNIALLACALWGVYRAIIAVYTVGALFLFAIWF